MARSLIVVLALFEAVHAGFNAKAWQSVGYNYTFPEQEYADVAAKKNVGITFSGGGDRAYIAAIGYLAAFHELGFTEDIKYIAGSSGVCGVCGILFLASFLCACLVLLPILTPLCVSVFSMSLSSSFYL